MLKEPELQDGEVVYPTHTCFDDALDFIEILIKAKVAVTESDLEKYRVVHAICEMPDTGELYAHGWVEDTKEHLCIWRAIIQGKSVWVRGEKSEFYTYFRVKEATVYTIREACEQNKLHNNYGPWKEEYRKLTTDGKRNTEAHSG